MAQNPLLGKRISLISKKNIRYEGLLYSINEQNATVALQNVRSYGTEGRELQEDSAITEFVPPNDAIHPYLLFRGQDIKDLHVHENQQDTTAPSPPVVTPTPAALPTVEAPKVASTTVPSNDVGEVPTSTSTSDTNEATATTTTKANATTSTTTNRGQSSTGTTQPRQQQQQQSSNNTSTAAGRGRGGGRSTSNYNNNNNNNSRSRNANTNNSNHKKSSQYNNSKEGTGASLLSRKERGVATNDPTLATEEFNFDTNNNYMDDTNNDNGVDTFSGDDNENTTKATTTVVAYSKDDFFDSISCDATDKQSGVDHRLRGQQERKLNTETFGAIALNNNHRQQHYRRNGNNNSGGGRYNNSRGGGSGGRGRPYNENADGNTSNTNNSNTRGSGTYRGRGGGRNGGNRGGRGQRNNGGSGRYNPNYNTSQQQQQRSTPINPAAATVP